jgi:L-amino acid N-acyltransferase YncA
MPFSRRLSTLRELARARRWGDLRLALWTATLPKFLFFYNVFVFVRLLEVKSTRLKMDHVEVREATREDLDDLRQVRDRAKGYDASFEAGHRCFLARVKGRPAAFLWFVTGETHRSGPNRYEIVLGPRSCYSYGVEVHKDFRLGGAILKLWIEAVRALRERGIETVYGAIPEQNHASVRTHLRLGFEQRARFAVLSVLGITVHRFEDEGGRRRFGFGGIRWEDPDARTP